MMQTVPPTPMEEAIRALEIALAKAKAEVTKIESALHQLRPQTLSQYQGTQQQNNSSVFIPAAAAIPWPDDIFYRVMGG